MSKKYIKVMTQEELDNMEELDGDFEIIEDDEDSEEKVSFFKKHKKGILLGAGATGLAALVAFITHACDKKKYASDDDFEEYEYDDDIVEDQEAE